MSQCFHLKLLVGSQKYVAYIQSQVLSTRELPRIHQSGRRGEQAVLEGLAQLCNA